jgi:hypothetical protein
MNYQILVMKISSKEVSKTQGNQFVRAAKNGGLAEVRKRIELGHDVNAKSIVRLTPDDR